MTFLNMLAVGFLVTGVVFAVYVRFAPNDPSRWHVDIASVQPATAGNCVDKIDAMMGSARAVCLLAGPADTVLAKLDTMAIASPRTTRLAGDANSGRITWITRSAVWGFPDYTTAQAVQTPEGTRLEIFARLRYGKADMGVNAARLRDWLTRL